MSAFMTNETRQWQERAREVAEKVVRPLAAKYDELQEYPWEIKEALAEAGLFGVWIPKAVRRRPGGTTSSTSASSWRSCRAPAVASACSSRSTPWARSPSCVGGTEEQKQKYLPQIAARREADRLLPLREVRRLRRRRPARAGASEDGDDYVL